MYISLANKIVVVV